MNIQSLAAQIAEIEKRREELYQFPGPRILSIKVDFQTHDHPEVQVTDIVDMFSADDIIIKPRERGQHGVLVFVASAFVCGVEFFDLLTQSEYDEWLNRRADD